MLTASEIEGLWVMSPTPCRNEGGGWECTDSVDLEETARMTELFVSAGVGGIAACGTTGEGPSLLWKEKCDFISAMVDTAAGRIPVFAGATALGTKETVRQMRELQQIGADGAFVGLPLWQTPTLENSIQFYADLSEAVPDLPVMVYANPMFFKSTFPTEFWQGIAAQAPTAITAKVAYDASQLPDDLAVTAGRIAFQPGQRDIFPAYERSRGHIRAAWSTTAAMGPEPLVALMRAIVADDFEGAERIWADIVSVPTPIPDRSRFPQYNAQLCARMTDTAGYIHSGPTRAPYHDLPDDWARQADEHAAAWCALRARYQS